MEEETTMLKIWKVFGKKSLKQSMDNLRQLMNVEKRLLSLTKIKQLTHTFSKNVLVFVSIFKHIDTYEIIGNTIRIGKDEFF